MNKYSIPDGMLQAATGGVRQLWDARYVGWNPSEDKSSIAFAACHAAIVWLSENPKCPTDAEIHEFYSAECEAGVSFEFLQRYAKWLQSRMFLTPEPQVPEELKDLLLDGADFIHGQEHADEANKNIIEAFRRGKNSVPLCPPYPHVGISINNIQIDPLDNDKPKMGKIIV